MQFDVPNDKTYSHFYILLAIPTTLNPFYLAIQITYEPVDPAADETSKVLFYPVFNGKL